MNEGRHLMASRALRLDQIREKPLHAAGHWRKVLSNVKNSHRAA
jgi:hypothetical protein